MAIREGGQTRGGGGTMSWNGSKFLREGALVALKGK